MLSIKEIDRILERLSGLFSIDTNCEITIELNPDDLDASYLRGLKKLNVNRVSLGIQSWRNEDLVMLNRRHNAAQAEKALKAIIVKKKI